MTKNNEPQKYEIESTPEEVYQQETYRRLVVIDDSGIVEEKELLEPMFDSLKNHRLTKFIRRIITPNSNLDVEVKFDRNGRSTIAKVLIHKKTFREKALEVLDSLSNKLNQKTSK